eukprot:TRINITY_DN5474_c0_g1_i1.p1 TRINITY_DN5474_c0_g1~~TRINITY_DN5474_c0_g1_i1.p1  ORF type:complete len:625 (-),score=80.05 TRINITY_DN5474_c0_g1_i1:242-2116(-)
MLSRVSTAHTGVAATSPFGGTHCPPCKSQEEAWMLSHKWFVRLCGAKSRMPVLTKANHCAEEIQRRGVWKWSAEGTEGTVLDASFLYSASTSLTTFQSKLPPRSLQAFGPGGKSRGLESARKAHNLRILKDDEPLCHKRVPVYVMLPLDTVTILNTLNHVRALQAGLRALKSIGVDGVMVDVWWGIVEAEGPGQYDWSAYLALVRLIQDAGLKVQAVMSFHGCGGNVGDTCHVSLPWWVLQEAEKNPDVLYTDRHGNRNNEYLSLGVDLLPLFHSRSPLQMYTEFIMSFCETFREFLCSTITEIVVGLGPAGELRYPSYPEGDGRWTYPGVGEFQCYDKYMLASLRAAAHSASRPEWGHGGPHDAGFYNNGAEETGFFHHEYGSFVSSYGDFFLSWYSEALITHGERILSAASHALRGTGVVVGGKLAGIHWWYKSRSHPAELTAGYYNTVYRDGYDRVVQMFARNKCRLNFTCVEMRDVDQPAHARSSPESLLFQVRQACVRHGVPLSGENALLRFDQDAHDQIIYNIFRPDRPHFPSMASFTYLRMGESLFQADNWRQFVDFVRRLRKGTLTWETIHDERTSWCALHQEPQLASNCNQWQDLVASPHSNSNDTGSRSMHAVV